MLNAPTVRIIETRARVASILAISKISEGYSTSSKVVKVGQSGDAIRIKFEYWICSGQ